MKVILAFAFIIVGINATTIPQREMRTQFDFTNKRLISGQIESAIEDASDAIKNAGLDPFHIKKKSSSYELPVPVLFNYVAIVEDILSTGLSNIKVHRVSYSIITNRLNFDVEMPLIHFSVASAKADGVIFSNKLDFDASGRIEVVSIRVTGVVRVRIGVISGISIRSISVDLKLGDIKSNAKLVVMGRDYSDFFNEFVGKFVPDTIKAHNKEINELLEIVLLELIEANL